MYDYKLTACCAPMQRSAAQTGRVYQDIRTCMLPQAATKCAVGELSASGARAMRYKRARSCVDANATAHVLHIFEPCSGMLIHLPLRHCAVFAHMQIYSNTRSGVLAGGPCLPNVCMHRWWCTLS